MPDMITVEHVGMLFDLNRGKVRSLKEKLLSKATIDAMEKERFSALDDISFHVEKGETFGIIGSNGAGKSTLLKVIAGIMKPTKGKVTTQGSIAPMIELGAGFDMELSAIENIYLCGAILGHTEQSVRSNVVKVLEFADLWDFRDVPVKYFSSGMLARLAFSSSSIISPDILIVDEVLSVGDYDFAQKSMKRMMELMSGGTTVVYVSHDIESVKRLCSRVMWLEHGKVQMTGPAAEVCDAYIEYVENKDKK
ncbi:MAG: ABC transporter ATP-binding protein [Clostridia bacterium]|nr:ABC transporter ATP-binding protein [Clostridia bacterium]